jgi:DNA-binding response OmpR family regulator
MKALLIEDDPQIGRLTQNLLEREGFSVDLCTTGAEGQERALAGQYELIVLDQGLPDRHGITVVEAMRKAGRTTPVIVVSGWSDSESMIRALDAGADDYHAKPISGDVFRARVRALVRRGGARQNESVSCGNLTLHRHKRRLAVDGSEMRATAKEVALLEQLMIRQGEIVSREELLENLWNGQSDPGSNVLNVTVARLRKKLADAGATATIEARRGIGFVLELSAS